MRALLAALLIGLGLLIQAVGTADARPASSDAATPAAPPLEVFTTV